MKQPTPIQISIPQPCSEDWNKMTPQQQGRFCDSCRKCVVDFTGFTDAQLYQFFVAHQGQKVCGRFNSVQLNRQINIPPQPHSQLYKWIMAAGLALVFVAAPEGKVFAQAPLVTQTIASNQFDIPGDTSKKEDTITIRGTVVDDNNEPVINAVVQAFSDGIANGGTVTDFDGNFKIPKTVSDEYTLKVNYIGYKESQIKIKPGAIVNGILIKIQPTSDFNLLEMGYVEYKIPLIDKFGGGNTKTITSEELEQMGH